MQFVSLLPFSLNTNIHHGHCTWSSFTVQNRDRELQRDTFYSHQNNILKSILLFSILLDEQLPPVLTF